jgi:arylsulfatase
MVVCAGGRFGGYGLYLLKGKAVFTYNLLGIQRVRWVSPNAIPPGKHSVAFDFKYDGLGAGTLAYNNFSGVGRGGTGTLSVDGKVVATQKLERTTPLAEPLDQTFDIGSAVDTPLDDRDYQIPFPFTAKIDKVTITVARPQLTADDIRKLQQARAGAGDAR